MAFAIASHRALAPTALPAAILIAAGIVFIVRACRRPAGRGMNSPA